MSIRRIEVYSYYTFDKKKIKRLQKWKFYYYKCDVAAYKNERNCFVINVMLHSIFHIVVNFSNLKKIDFQQQQQKKVFQLPSFFSSTASSSGCGVGDRFFSVGGSDGGSFLFSIVDVMRFQMLSKESLPVR